MIAYPCPALCLLDIDLAQDIGGKAIEEFYDRFGLTFAERQALLHRSHVVPDHWFYEARPAIGCLPYAIRLAAMGFPEWLDFLGGSLEEFALLLWRDLKDIEHRDHSVPLSAMLIRPQLIISSSTMVVKSSSTEVVVFVA